MAHNPHPLAPLTPGLCSPVVYMGDAKQESGMLRSRLTIDNPESIPACVIVTPYRDMSQPDGIGFRVTALAPWAVE